MSTDPIEHIIELKGQLGELRQAVTASDLERRDSRLSQREIQISLEHITRRISMMPDEEHRQHHAFIRAFINEHRQRQALRDEVMKRLAAGGAVAAAAATIGLVWYAIKSKYLGH